ncbi:MAG: sigma factor [Acidimicrobiales bacterium]
MTSVLRPAARPVRTGLLSYADQVRLARSMEAGREAERRLDGTRRLGAAERARLEEAVADGDVARRELIECHAQLVLTEAQRYAGSDRQTLVDLVQQGNIGLVHAVDRFDWRRGVRLATYASRWIRLAIASDRPDLAEPGLLRPDASVVREYRQRVASLDAGPDGQPARLAEAPTIERSPSPSPSGPIPWELM